MREISDTNFAESYPHLSKELKKASFIAIDTEFTGINSNGSTKESPFDTIEERYAKLRQNIEPFIIIQFGITAFSYKEDRKSYVGSSYNFYLLPRSIPKINRQFVWQVAALEFLSQHRFDFNRSVYQGISYVNEEDNTLLLEQLKKNEFHQNVEQCMTYADEDKLEKVCETIQKKLRYCESIRLTIETDTPAFQYSVHKQLRSRFPNIWTLSGTKAVHVIGVSTSTRNKLERQEGNILEEALMDSYIGFTKVFQLLCSLKKPIIGHNLLLDLMFMHQQFYKPLPSKYTQFKENIHQLFPYICDTKYMSLCLKNKNNFRARWKLSSLSCLHQYFMENKNLPSGLAIDLAATNSFGEFYHNAGWDSYYAGYVFLRLIFLVDVQTNGQQFTSVSKVLPAEILISAAPYVNRIPFVHDEKVYMNLSGPDPEMPKPKILLVKTSTKDRVDLRKVAAALGSGGTVRVKPYGRQQALVTVANQQSAQSIIERFRYHKVLRVEPYNPIRRIVPGGYLVWGSLISIVSGGVIVWMFHRNASRPT